MLSAAVNIIIEAKLFGPPARIHDRPYPNTERYARRPHAFDVPGARGPIDAGAGFLRHLRRAGADATRRAAHQDGVQTSRARASPATAPRLPDADPRRPSAGQTRDLPVPVQRASAHARVFDHAGAAGARAIAPARVAFRVIKHVGLRIEDFSRLNGWPTRSAINASPPSSQMSPHDLGVSVVRYTFTARDFHSLLFAGFAGALIMSLI